MDTQTDKEINRDTDRKVGGMMVCIFIAGFFEVFFVFCCFCFFFFFWGGGGGVVFL